MNPSETIATMAVLRHFGFQPNGNPLFDECLVYQFDNFDVEAALCVSEYSQKRVFFSGITPYRGNNFYDPIDFNLSCRVMCVWQCAALLAYYLRDYPIPNPPWWLADGRNRNSLLPWVIEEAARKAAYDALPKCFIQRDWLRLTLKTLSAQIASMPDEIPVDFKFNDGILSIQCNKNAIVAPGTGSSWPDQVTVSVRELRTLPKRLMSENVCILVAAGFLSIGNSSHKTATNPARPSGWAIGCSAESRWRVRRARR